MWTAFNFAMLLVIWSPWVNGFTLSCFFFLCVLGFPSNCFPLRTCQFLFYFFFYILHRITLEIMTLQPKCEDVETAEGVAITVTGVAQVNHHTFSGNASSDSTNLPTHFHPLFFHWNHLIITPEVESLPVGVKTYKYTCIFCEGA